MNITTIIPIHEYNDDLSGFVTNAVESVIKQEGVDKLPLIALVFPPAIEEGIVGFRDSMIRKHQGNVNHESFLLLKNEGKTDFQSQINFGVDNVTTDYFSILEFDDEYSNTYFKNASKYIEKLPNVDIFLTMMIETNEKNEGLKLTNETVWSQQFVGENGEMGYLNLNSLNQYTDFKISGAVIKKSDFLNVGGLKSNVKLTFNYEYLLRSLTQASKIYTIPKIGYKHLAVREGSLFDEYGKTISMEERKFWFETAKKEANVTKDREIDMSKLKK